MAHHAQYINCGVLLGRVAEGLGRAVWCWSAGGEQLRCASLVIIIIIIIIIINNYYCILLNFQLLDCS